MVIAIISLVLATLFGIIGPLARRRLRRVYPAPGKMVDVGGYGMHVHVLGQDGPAVVFDTGAGATGLAWAPMQREVASFTTAVTYDRAGLGWSEAGRDPRRPARRNTVMVEELHVLLHKAGIPAPYVLVGHSLGGLNARLYAHTYPEEVAGLVLVDAVHEAQFAPPPIRDTMRRMARMMPAMYGILRLLVYSGLPALRPTMLQSAVNSVFGAGSVPEDVMSAYRALLAANPRHLGTSAKEMQAIDASHAEIRERGLGQLNAIPVVVISHGRVEETAMIDADVARLAEETFQQCQRDMASESPLGEQIIATESGHNIPFEQPELVLNSIREVVSKVRGRQAAVQTPLAPSESTTATL